MDTVHEETCLNMIDNLLPEARRSHPQLTQHLNVPNHDTTVSRPNEGDNDSAVSSRRPSIILAALRRPSQVVALSAAHAIMNQRRYLLGYFNGQSERSLTGRTDHESREEIKKIPNKNPSRESLTIILSALYAKLLVVLGIAFPLTEIISKDVRAFFFQGFYLYLYLGCITFVSFMYGTLVREKAVFSIVKSYQPPEKSDGKKVSPVRYGSFYLRLGAIAFGIGSMVHSGLEFGRYFELKNNTICSSVLQAITPAARMLLTLLQIQFIFLNSKDIEMYRHIVIARFGLMHMIATNLCEWLYVIVEETKHEIFGLEKKHNITSFTEENNCPEGHLMGSLVSKASPFLFPCTIEYSLICAVILFEMWKNIRKFQIKKPKEDVKKNSAPNAQKEKDDKTTHFNVYPFSGNPINPNHHFSVDCSNAHRGLFAGIMIIVLTIISLIMFFVLSNEMDGHKAMAEFEVNIVELVLYSSTIVAIITAMLQMRHLKYDRKYKDNPGSIGLDNTLLVVAQTGMFIYCMFAIIGCYFKMSPNKPTGMLAEIFSFVQTFLQTMFILDTWWRRCRTIEQTRTKPGREVITFLIIANMAMWTINALEKNQADFRQQLLNFYGDWAWTIITHISMPLAIFYRFHSTICLFEIWKNAYKIKAKYKTNGLQYL